MNRKNPFSVERSSVDGTKANTLAFSHSEARLGAESSSPLVRKVSSGRARYALDPSPGLTDPQGYNPDEPLWVLYDRLERRPYVWRKMDWHEVSHELKVLLGPYSEGHEWRERLVIKYWGTQRFPRRAMLTGNFSTERW